MLANRPVSAEDAIEALLAEPWLEGLTAAHRVIEPRPPRHAPWPDDLDPRLVAPCACAGWRRCGPTRRRPSRPVRARKNACVVTPTASGKTLCYNLPVLEAVARRPAARALYLFPTKALGQDQLVELRAFAEQPGVDLETGTYDGDTPAPVRRRSGPPARSWSPTRTCSTQRILPHHTKWFKLFENLRFVVIDELHTYRGVFGSHVANVLRRLRRICAHYGSRAGHRHLLGDHRQPARAGRGVDGPPSGAGRRQRRAGRGERILVLNPPVVNDAAGDPRRRLCPRRASRRWRFLRAGGQTIVFGRSRTSGRAAPDPVSARGTSAARGPVSRIRVATAAATCRTSGARSRRACATARCAASWPPTPWSWASTSVAWTPPSASAIRASIAGTWQQMGRAGRRQEASARRSWSPPRPDRPVPRRPPGFPLRSIPEQARLDPDNLHVLLAHLRAATFELPFVPGERFGPGPADDSARVLEEASRPPGGRRALVLGDENFPARRFSLRTGADENVVIIDTGGDRPRVIGEIDLFAAAPRPREGHLHPRGPASTTSTGWTGRSRRPTSGRWTWTTTPMPTWQSRSRCWKSSTEPMRRRRGRRQRGEVMVAWKVTMFKKIKFHTHENVGWGSISIPEQEMHTTSTWLVPPAELVNRYDRDTLDGALIGLARRGPHDRRAPAHVRPARPRGPRPGAGAVHRPADVVSCTTRSPAGSG